MATCSNYLVILKVHGSAIKLLDGSLSASNKTTQPTYRLLCRDLEARAEQPGSGVQVFLLDKAATSVAEKSLFRSQQRIGLEVQAGDLALFMSAPMEASRKAAYAIEVGVNDRATSTEDLGGQEGCKRLGAAFVYLEPGFSTRGAQQVQILSAFNKAPIGQLQVEYLVVTNPNGFGSQAPRPEWLSRRAQLDAGHRGAGSGCRADLGAGPIVENTVASFNYAAEHGADMCELDVMCTADGVPVVYHNYQLNTSQPLQIDQLTLSELRQLRHRKIHDKDCQHDKEDRMVCAELDKRHQQFPTLEEVLRDVDKACALNIELKWAQILANGKSEAKQNREINDYVDRVLDCIQKHEDGRPILLSTLNADIAILLRLKQITYPVLFLTTGDDTRFNDPATKTIKSAIHFAQAFDMAGINPNAKMLNEFLCRYARDRGLLVYAWGDIRSAQAVKELRNYGLDGVIYDKIDLIKPQD